MSAEGGVWVDILTRLNMASVNTALNEMQSVFGRAGKDASKAFSHGADFRNQMNDYRGAMRDWMRDMDRYEREMGNFGKLEASYAKLGKTVKDTYTTMVADAQKAAIEMERANTLMGTQMAKSSRAMAEASAGAAAVSRGKYEEANSRYIASEPRRPEAPQDMEGPRPPTRDRGAPIIPLSRGAGAIGLGAMVLGAGVVAEGVRSSAQIQNNLNTLSVMQQETPGNIGRINQAVYRQATETGFGARDISKMYATAETASDGRTGKQYRGQDAIDIVENALKLARTTGGKLSPEDALQGLTTTMHDYRVGPEGSSGVAGQLMAALAQQKGSPEDFFHSLHTIEPAAMMAGIKPEEIFGALGMMSQTGQSNQQSANNLSNVLKSFSAPNATTSKALGQLGLNPGTMSTELSQKGLAGTLQEVMQAIAKDEVGPNGSVVLGAMAKNELAQQQQGELKGQMSDQAKALVDSEDFKKSLMSGFQIRKIMAKNKGAYTANDEPLIETYLKHQKDLEGASDVLKKNKPEEESLYAAYGQAFNTKDAARAAIMLAGSPEALSQYKQREEDNKNKGTPNAFEDAFKKSMDTDINKWHQLGQEAGELAGRIGHDLLPVIGDITTGFKNTLDFLNRNEVAMDALIGVVTALAGAYGFVKIVNGIGKLASAVEDTITGIGAAKTWFGKIGSLAIPDMQAMATAEAAAATQITTAGTTAATTIEGGAATLATEEATAGAGLQASLTTAGTTAATTIEGGAATLATEEATAGASLATGIAAAIPALMATISAGLIAKTSIDIINPHANEAAPPKDKRSWWDTVKSWMSNGEADDHHESSSPGAHPSHAHGGIVGYGSGGQVADPYSQPLMGQQDMRRDSILGMLPGGMPVGLRGGEGILTPDAVAAIGGKPAIDALNQGYALGGVTEDAPNPFAGISQEGAQRGPFPVGTGPTLPDSVSFPNRKMRGVYTEPSVKGNPWENPLDVAATFYGSFASGVAKYSPWGKYLQASGQTINSLAQAHDSATRENESGTRTLDRGLNAGEEAVWSADARAIHKAMGLNGKEYQYGGLDCSGYLSEVYSSMAGMPPGRKFSTTSNFAALGFHRGYMPGALNIGVTPLPGQSGHMAGTLPNGVNIESGGRDNKVKYGHGAHGATDGQFSDHWWYMPGYSKGGVVGFADGGITPGMPGPNGSTGTGRVPGSGMRPNLPDWWHGGADNGDVPPWWNGAQWGDRQPGTGWGVLPGIGGPLDSGGSPGLPMLPSGGLHPKNGIGGFSTGGIVGFDPGGVIPIPGMNQAAPPPPTVGPSTIDQPGLNGGPAPNPRSVPPSMPMPTAGKNPLQDVLNGGPNSPFKPYGPKTAEVKPPDGPAPGVTPEGPTDPNAPPPTPREALTPKSDQPGNFSTPEGDRNIMGDASRQGGMDNHSKGFAVGGGLIGSAEGAIQSAISAAGLGADAMGGMGGGSAGAAAANQALQIGFQLANRAIGYGGQLVGILGSGLLETFLPNDSPLADPTHNLFGKIALGIAGAHPTPQNLAGDSAMQLKPKEDLDSGSQQPKTIMPMVHMDHPTINNHSAANWDVMHQEIGKAMFGAGQLGG